MPAALSRAVADFLSRPARSSRRQEEVQLWCARKLALHGLPGAEIEVALPGAYRAKNWDVGKLAGGEPRLAISCKSIISNISGTVPNRLDDMLGEAVNLHRAYPRCVIGYLLFLSEVDRKNNKPVGEWFDRCGERLELCFPRLSSRAAPERWESICLLSLPDSRSPKRYTAYPGCDDLDEFFARLVEQYRLRFP